MSLAELVINNPVFTHLTDVQQEQVVRMAITRQYPKGQWIVYHGDIWPFLFMVEAGKVDAVKESDEGRSLIVTTFLPGDIFWGVAFFVETAPMPVGLIANQASRLCLWPQEGLLPLLKQNGNFTWELSRLMVKRMVYASRMLEEMAFQPVTSRLARLLLEHFSDAVGDYVARDLTLDEMAARIGTTREMVCRQLYKFAEDGTIEIKRTELLITNRDELAKLAGR